MKKSLIALAVLAASGAAMAQSSVTLYGVADIWAGQTNTKTAAKAAVVAAPATATAVAVAAAAAAAATDVTQTVLNTNGANSSRWGLKGTEDLGGGLKAVFQLESGFNIDTGAQTDAASLFNRQAFVGVSGGFGTLTAGRQYTAYDALRAATNNTYDTASFTTTGTVFGYGAVADYASRVNNSIAYTSPTFSGVSGAVVLGLGEDKVAATTTAPAVDASQNVSLHIKYANGPVLVGYAYQDQKAQYAFSTPTTLSTKYNLIAGSYDFGMAKIVAGYNTAALDNKKDKEYQVGVNMPIGTAANVAVGYAKTTGEVAGTTTANGSGYSLVGLYDLSKRTRLYAGYSKTKTDNNAGVETKSTSALGVGVRHNF